MPFYPFLIAFYAVLALFSDNLSEVSVNVIWRLLIVLTLCIGILLILIRRLTKDWQRSGLIAGFFLLLFFTYGHVYNFLKNDLDLKDVTVEGVHVFHHQFLIGVWLVLGMIGMVLIQRIKDLSPFTLFANSMSIVMLLFPLYDIGVHLAWENKYNGVSAPQTTSLHLPAGRRAPDIYFIVLDAYGRDDILRQEFNLDNSGFIRDLQNMGFYVVKCSQSNYARTKLSIGSTLNMDYIQNLAPNTKGNEISLWLKPYMINSRVRGLFKELGYKVIAFYNGYEWLHWKNADYFLQEGEKTSIRLQLATTVTPFEELFLNTTFVRAIIDLRLAGASVSSSPSQRETVLYTLKTLPEIPKISGPKFVYAHLILPHPPFVFGPNGEEKNLGYSDEEVNDASLYRDESMRAGFHDQTLYTNKQIIPILRSIIEESPVPPIIVLESDHGPTSYGGIQNRMGNFMAYYFPGKDASRLAYPSITPVNSFRLVFDAYFGGDYPLLKDVSYFSEQSNDFDFRVVPNTCAQQ